MPFPPEVLAYPPDGGLKPPVRPYEKTRSLNDVLEAERRRQQQDPAHDQGPFNLRVNGVEYPVTDVKITVHGQEELPAPPPSLRGQVTVTGTVEVKLVDPVLTRVCLYGEPIWKARLMVAFERAGRVLRKAAAFFNPCQGMQ